MSEHKSPVVLVISTGAQDIKRWVGWTDRKTGTEDIEAKPLPKFDCRAWHAHLWPDADKPETWRARFMRTVDEVRGIGTPVSIEALGHDPNWAPLLKDDLNRERGTDLLYRHDDKLLLQPTRVAELLDALDCGDKDLEVQRTVILYSDRPAWRNAKEEPFRNGPALGHWLAAELGIPALGQIDEPGKSGFQGSESGVVWVNYLRGLTLYEGSLNTRNFPLHTCAVRAIEATIADAARGIDDAYAIYTSRGGFGDIKPIIAGACELYFAGRTYCHWETEHRQELDPEKPETIDLARITSQTTYAIPADTVPARARAAGRLREGDILGAWGSVAHLDSIQQDRAWLDAMRDLAAYFRGESPERWVADAVGLKPEDPTGTLLLRAIQVETALQGETNSQWRVPDALISTTAFLDLSLELAIVRSLGSLGHKPDPQTMRFDPEVTALRPEIRRLVEAHPSWKSQDGWFPELFLDGCRINTLRGPARAWRIWLGDAGNPAADAHTASLLSNLDDFLVKQSINEYRNQLAHRSLADTDAPVRKASKIRRPHGTGESLGPLWLRLNADGTPRKAPLGDIFLTSPLIQPIFAAFGVPDPRVRYERLIDKALSALSEPTEVV